MIRPPWVPQAPVVPSRDLGQDKTLEGVDNFPFSIFLFFSLPICTKKVWQKHNTLDWLCYSNDLRKALIHTNGACLSNGQISPKAPWAF